jgi:hypothetical protein
MDETVMSEGGAHHHGGHVFQAGVAALGQRHAELAQHVGHRLALEFDLAAVARALQAHHQAVADELVLAHALDLHQVAQRCGARGRGGGALLRQGRGRDEAQSDQQADHEAGEEAHREPVSARAQGAGVHARVPIRKASRGC